MKDRRRTPFTLNLFFLRIYRFLTTVIIRLLSFRLTISGTENIPKEGAYLIAANHVGHLDPYLFTIIFSGQLCYMARPNRFLLRLLGGVDTTGSIITTGPSAVREAIRRVAKNRILVFFPEGERNDGSHPLEIRSGAAFVALKTGAKVLPVKISGTGEALNFRTRSVKPGAEIRVSIGEPIVFGSYYYSKPARIMSEEATQVIMRRITQLD